MEKKLFLVFLIGCFCVASYAQDYPLNNDKADLDFPVNQQALGFISDTRVVFDAMGGTDSHIQVTCKDGWFSVNNNDWLEVSENGDRLVVRCRPNPASRARVGQISIVGGNGTRTVNITVQQEATGKVSSNSTVQKPAESANRDSYIPVKVSFDAGQAAPSFENVWSIIRLLENNHNLGLQIEIPWCRSGYSIKLIEQRTQNITDYFVTSGIEKDRITQHINIIDENESDMECDGAHLKIVEH